MKEKKIYTNYSDKCLCQNEESEWKEVTTEIREGKGLWKRCDNCGLVVNKLGFSKDELESYYNNQYQKANSFAQGEKLSPKDHYNFAQHSLKPVASILKPYLNDKMRVLDIGAATGELLDNIKSQVGYCIGIELNKEYCHFINKELGIDAISEDYFEITFDASFDLITINATLDHMYNSLGVLDKIYDDLKPGAILYIQTPNDEQALKTFLPERSRLAFQAFMYQKAHYVSFTESTLKRALVQAGFEVERLFTRHDYSLKNFLHWYFTGSRQKNINDAKISRGFFNGSSRFEVEFNAVLEETERSFQEIINRNNAGELICCIARRA